MKKMTALLLAALLAFSLAACGQKQNEPTNEDEAGSTLVYGSGDYTAINPALYEHGEINLLLFAGLTAHGEDNRVVPDVAEKWEFDEAANTYTFHLRRDVYFHDGVQLTAAEGLSL